MSVSASETNAIINAVAAANAAVTTNSPFTVPPVGATTSVGLPTQPTAPTVNTNVNTRAKTDATTIKSPPVEASLHGLVAAAAVASRPQPSRASTRQKKKPKLSKKEEEEKGDDEEDEDDDENDSLDENATEDESEDEMSSSVVTSKQSTLPALPSSLGHSSTSASAANSANAAAAVIANSAPWFGNAGYPVGMYTAALAASAAAQLLPQPAQRKRKRKESLPERDESLEPAIPTPIASATVAATFAITPPGQCRLSALPVDWMNHIFSFMAVRQVLVLSRTSKHFREIGNNARVWKEICRRQAPYPCNHTTHPWKELAMQRMDKIYDKRRDKKDRHYKKKYFVACYCCKCTKAFQLQAEYDRHVALRHGPNRQLPPVPKPRLHVDPYTGKDLPKTENGKDYPCPFMGCGRAFKKAIELKYHFDGVHKQERAFPCDYPNCFKSFVSPAQLALHQCKHTGAARPHKCPRTDIGCQKSFNTPSQLANHQQTHLLPTERNMLPCHFPGCGRSYHSHSAVQKHYATEHDESQLHYRCSDIGLMSIFLPPGQLEGVTTTCKSAFYFKATWKEHLVTKHKITPTHQQLQQVVQYIKTNKCLAKINIGSFRPPLPPMSLTGGNVAYAAAAASASLPNGSGAAAAAPADPTQSPQQAAATAVANAMRAANVSTVPSTTPITTSAPSYSLPNSSAMSAPLLPLTAPTLTPTTSVSNQFIPTIPSLPVAGNMHLNQYPNILTPDFIQQMQAVMQSGRIQLPTMPQLPIAQQDQPMTDVNQPTQTPSVTQSTL